MSTILRITKNGQVVEIKGTHENFLIEALGNSIVVDASQGSFSEGVITQGAGIVQYTGTDTIDMVQAKQGSIIRTGGGDDYISVSGTKPLQCVVDAGDGDDFIRVIAGITQKRPTCDITGGEGSDEFFTVGVNVVINDFGAGDRIYVGTNVNQRLSEYGLIVESKETIAMIVQRDEPLTALPDGYLGF